MENAVHLAEGRGHFVLVILLGQVFFLAPHAFKTSGVGHGFVIFVGQFVGEEFGEEVADAALEPDVEEVGQFGVLHVVVVGRVYGNVVYRTRWLFSHTGSRTSGDC